MGRIVKVFALFLVGSGLVAALLWVATRRGEPEAQIVPADAPTVGLARVYAADLAVSLKEPYFTTVPFALKKGDRVFVTAEGAGGFDRVFRARTSDRVSPNGWHLLGRQWKGPRGGAVFPMPDAPIAALLGQIGGEIRYRKKGTRTPYVEGTRPFFVGERTAFDCPLDGYLHLFINEMWLPGAWEDNWGSFTAHVTVWRRE